MTFKKSIKFTLKLLLISSINLFSINPAISHILIDESNDKNDYINQKIPRRSFVSNAIAKAGQSVVTIETTKTLSSRNSNIPELLIDPYFEKFFGLKNWNQIPTRIEQNQGSGVIFAKGLVLTNAHVVNNSDTLIVGLSDGRRIEGKVIGQDALTDLAVIKLIGKGPWPKATLGNSDAINVGDWAIAVGNPYGLENTVTLGIISNLNRNVAQLGIAGKRFELIQTDAAINPGNSGGPLLNIYGEVIGINTLVRSGPGAGLGFAIPINKAKNIADQLIQFGKAIHPMLGISLTTINPERSNLNSDKFAKITYIVPNSPADKSGLKINDIILKINDKFVDNPADIIKEVTNNGIEKYLKLIVLRGTRKLNILVKPIDIRSL
tara:strand:+ start:3164 stop:4300 length:1137 start_codon:yes stop_codon:yes gene_type:complete